MLKRFTVIGILTISQALWAADPLSLRDLLLRARESNPELIAARHFWLVKKAAVAPEGAWPDPVFSLSREKSVMGDPGMPQQRVDRFRVEQMIPFPGKKTQEAKMAYHEALLARMAYRAKMIALDRDVRMRFYQIYLTDEQIRLAEESVTILDHGVRTAQARLASNQASASDVFMAQTELEMMKNELIAQKSSRTLAEIEMNTLLNQDTQTPLGSAEPPELSDVPVSLEELRTLARVNDPDYQNAVHEVRHAEARRSLGRLAFAPDFGLMYEIQKSPDRPNGRMAGVSISLPVWISRPWGELRAAQEHVKEADAKSRDIENGVMRELHRELVETQARLALARNDQTSVIPSALASLRVAREQYASGQGDFMRLLESFRTWINANKAYEEQLYAYAEHWSELERWTGVPLNQAREALDLLKVMPPDEEMNHGH